MSDLLSFLSSTSNERKKEKKEKAKNEGKDHADHDNIITIIIIMMNQHIDVINHIIVTNGVESVIILWYILSLSLFRGIRRHIPSHRHIIFKVISVQPIEFHCIVII